MNCHSGCSREFVGAAKVSKSNLHNAAVTSCKFNGSPKKVAIINKKKIFENLVGLF